MQSGHILVTREMRPFEVTCYAPKSLPPAKVWWENEKGKIMSSSDTIRSNLLFKTPRGDTDSGKYTCFAENLSGKTNTTIQLIVSGKVSKRAFFLVLVLVFNVKD